LELDPSEGTAHQEGHCPLCNGVRLQPVFQVPFPDHSKLDGRAFPVGVKLDVPAWTIARCEGCTARFPHPYPSADEIDHYYASQEEPSDWEWLHYVELPAGGRRAWHDFAQRLTRLHGGPGRLLEVGCAAGWLLKGAEQEGWDVFGIEASPKFANYARDVQGLRVATATIADLMSAESTEAVRAAAPFDVVVLTDVLEHLHDPVTDLKVLRQVIADDGYLVVTTLDIGSPIARLYGLRWRQIIVSHIVYWTRPSIRLALGKAGFAVSEISDVRYWDPSPELMRRRRLREYAKFGARAVLSATYMPVARRSARFQKIPGLLSRGRLTHTEMQHKVGDQPVIGDVMIVTATPNAGRA
jgi:SAM-dependent methyltransferase